MFAIICQWQGATVDRNGILKGGNNLKNKWFIRSTTMLVMLVLMLSLLSISAFAAGDVVPYSSADLKYYEVAPISMTYFAQIETGKKDNTTPSWLRIDSLTNGDKVRVRVVGSSEEDHACTYNDYNLRTSIDFCSICTRCTTKGNWVPFVLCKKGVNYAINSIVKESGYSYSSLGFQSTSTEVSQTVSGWWSADSTNYSNYASPEAG